MDDCLICNKHNNKETFLKLTIHEGEYFYLSHYPEENGVGPYKGHLLIEPKIHIEKLSEIPAKGETEFLSYIRNAESMLRDKFGAEHVYLTRIGDKVSHVHFHLLPRYPNTPKKYWFWKLLEWPEAARLTSKLLFDNCEKLKKFYASYFIAQNNKDT